MTDIDEIEPFNLEENDDIFLLGYPLHSYMGSSKERWEQYLARERFIYSRKIEDFDDLLTMIDARWRELVPDPIDSARLHGYYFAVLQELAFHFAWEVYQDRNRGLRSIRYVESEDFMFRDINMNGCPDDPSKWTPDDKYATLKDFIEIENEKGNHTYLLAVKPTDKTLKNFDNVNPAVYAALRILVSRFPEQRIDKEW